MDMMWYRRRGLMVTPHIESVTGAIASFNSDYNKIPIKSLICDIEPIQDLHGYDSPWPAGGGKNLLDWNKVSVDGTHYGMTFSKGVAEGTVTTTGTLSVTSGSVAPIIYADNSLSGKGYVFLTEHISGDSVVDLARTYGLRTETEKSIAVYLSGTSGQSYTETIRISVYAPPAPVTWSPYSNICPISGRPGLTMYRSGSDTSNPTSFPVSWETEAGTVYGGYVDVVSGKLVVDRAMVDLGTLSWNYEASIPRFYSTGINSVIKKVDNGSVANCVSSMFKVTSFNDLYIHSKQNGTMSVNDAGTLSIIDNAYSDTASFRTAMSGVQLCYELATPTEIQLTPQEVKTLLGDNNIWCDSGSVSVDYWKWGK